MELMRYLRWILWILVFVLLFGFALKNTDAVVVRYFLGWEWRPPLSLALFVFFAAGAVLGVLAGTVALYRQRRELVELRREQRATQAASQTQDAQPERPFL
jgi:lipopolysaccharide assembly protein A